MCARGHGWQRGKRFLQVIFLQSCYACIFYRRGAHESQRLQLMGSDASVTAELGEAGRRATWPLLTNFLVQLLGEASRELYLRLIPLVNLYDKI